MSGALTSFLLVYSGLFSIINPIGGAVIFSQVTAGRSRDERLALARRIGLYSALIMLGALWCGGAILAFFGVSIAALRIAGGLIVASFAWQLLHAPEKREEAKQGQAQESEGLEAIAFFPLTLPFTTGPGTISVAVALGATVPAGSPGYAAFVIMASLAALAMAGTVALAYGSADRVVRLLGQSGARVVSRLSAFLLLCVGTQIALNGITDFVRSL
ncbi:MAG: family transporter [Enterovirga sp.]|jgi:multiple antibiotic resistance protein|nr:family transporter [Enterovirga sp.]